MVLNLEVLTQRIGPGMALAALEPSMSEKEMSNVLDGYSLEILIQIHNEIHANLIGFKKSLEKKVLKNALLKCVTVIDYVNVSESARQTGSGKIQNQALNKALELAKEIGLEGYLQFIEKAYSGTAQYATARENALKLVKSVAKCLEIGENDFLVRAIALAGTATDCILIAKESGEKNSNNPVAASALAKGLSLTGNIDECWEIKRLAYRYSAQKTLEKEIDRKLNELANSIEACIKIGTKDAITKTMAMVTSPEDCIILLNAPIWPEARAELIKKLVELNV